MDTFATNIVSPLNCIIYAFSVEILDKFVPKN